MSFSPRPRKNKSREFEPPMPEALAYFLTWPTYGTWLPGDERGWVQFRRGTRPPDPIVEREAKARMAEDACRLDHEERTRVETTIAEHCRLRGWALYAVNCRSNHVHVVVAATLHPNLVREQFKAWCTRRLKGLARIRQRANPSIAPPGDAIRERWWAERGSGTYLNDERALEAVIHYVQVAQDLPRE